MIHQVARIQSKISYILLILLVHCTPTLVVLVSKPCPHSQEHCESPGSPEHTDSGVREHDEISAICCIISIIIPVHCNIMSRIHMPNGIKFIMPTMIFNTKSLLFCPIVQEVCNSGNLSPHLSLYSAVNVHFVPTWNCRSRICHLNTPVSALLTSVNLYPSKQSSLSYVYNKWITQYFLIHMHSVYLVVWCVTVKFDINWTYIIRPNVLMHNQSHSSTALWAEATNGDWFVFCCCSMKLNLGAAI